MTKINMKKAFTIMELILVIAVIAIISAILLPKLIQQYDTSKENIIEIYNEEKKVINIDKEGNILESIEGYKLIDIIYKGNIIYCVFELEK